MRNNFKVSVIICAAGSSSRMGGTIKKEYLPLKNGTVLSESVKKFLNAINVDYLLVTVPKNGEEEAKNALFCDKEVEQKLSDSANNKKTELFFVQGGNTRTESVFNALNVLIALPFPPDFVLIHDGARPFVTEEIIKETLENTILFGAASPAITPTDTQKLIDKNGFITEHLNRSLMASIQTPQGFKLKELYTSHLKAKDDGHEYTDDTEIYGKYSGEVKIVSGSPLNKKITYQNDYSYENKAEKNKMNNLRTGLGYDLHRLVPERKLIIGGLTLPFEKGEDGHSDGDALLHAITDSLLGASGLGDIGSFFPPEEAKWKDADSGKLLKTVWNKITESGWSLINLDCVVKLEKPKFLPYRNAVIENIANILNVKKDRIFVKAKTGEKLDSVGSGNAIEAWCTCLLCK